MKIAVIGAGAIGSLVAGYLKLKDEDVTLIGRPEAVNAIIEHGLQISGVRGDFKVPIEASELLISTPDIAIIATKTQDIEGALKDNLFFLKDSVILTTQNGVQADYIVAKHIPKENIISSIVMFGATYLEPGKVVHNFEGSWIMGSIFRHAPGERIIMDSIVFDKVFPTLISEDILGMKYLKIFVNANNCIPAILGVSMQEAFSDLEISSISQDIWKEGFDIICKAGINLVSLPGFPLENVTKMVCMPGFEAAKIFSGTMTKLSKDPLYGSILQSIKRGRRSEIDYINGEFLRLAQEHGLAAPLNKKLVDMVHEVEQTNKFFTKEELLDGTRGLVK